MESRHGSRVRDDKRVEFSSRNGFSLLVKREVVIDARLPSNHKRESDCSPDARGSARVVPVPGIGQVSSTSVLRIQWPAPFCLDHFCRSNLNCWLAAV